MTGTSAPGRQEEIAMHAIEPLQHPRSENSITSTVLLVLATLVGIALIVVAAVQSV